MTPVTFRVLGLPVAQGSTRAFVNRGRAIVTHDNGVKIRSWRQDIAARAVLAGALLPSLGPMRVVVTFAMPRPVSRPKRHRWPDVRPDLDKLVRAVLDALTGIAWRDDGQVVELIARKSYAGWVGAEITVEPMP